MTYMITTAHNTTFPFLKSDPRGIGDKKTKKTIKPLDEGTPQPESVWRWFK